MTIRRRLHMLLLLLLVMAGLGWGGWSLLKARLDALGIEQVAFSGLEVGWNHLAFRSVSLVWNGEGRSLHLEAERPRFAMDWSDWQLDRLAAGPTRIQHSLAPDTDPASTSGKPASALQLTLPESMPFWLPRHLDIESLQASFPCQGTRCRFEGHTQFDRQTEGVTVTVDATLARNQETLAIRGDVSLGSGAAAAAVTGGELRISGIRPWLPATADPVVRRLVPDAAELQFAPGGEPAPGQWPIQVTLTSQGGARPAFDGRIVLHTGDPWRVEITRGRVSGTLDRWQRWGWLFKGIAAELPLTGTLGPERSRLTFGQAATLRVRHMDAFESEQLMWLDAVALSVDGSTVTWRDGQARLAGPMALTADEVRYPGLVTQAWRASADVQWHQSLAAEGELGNRAGTRLPFTVDYQPSGALEATLSMALTTDNRANQLADTVTAWPPSLVMEQGRVDASVRLSRAAGEVPEATATVTFTGASGLYRNMAWQTLDGELQGHWDGRRITAGTDDLALAQLNPGVPLGPLRLAARYRADTGAPGKGTLVLARASAGFAGGTLRVAEQTTWDLTDNHWRLPVTVEGVQLSALMNLYPTEGLSGEGTLTGQLPVRLGPQGIRIDNGRITALPPGGRLQLPADKLGSLAQANDAMALVARAMEDFHYRVLESGIHYQPDGTLLLDLTVKGSSPKVDSDRPVVLNINLEEDIPALLTSLQLSGRVNDAVRKRVRERLMQEGVDARGDPES